MKAGNKKNLLDPKEGYADITDDVSQYNSLLLSLSEQISDALIRTDSFFNIESWNQPAEKLLDFENTEMAGRNVFHALSVENSADHQELINNHLSIHGSWQGRLNIINRNSIPLIADCYISTIPGQGCLLILKSTSPALNPNAILRAQVLTQSFINALAEGLIVQNLSGEVILSNKTAESITGMLPQQMGDKYYLENIWNCFKENGEPFKWDELPGTTVLHTGKPQKNVVLGVKKSDGKTTWININSQPVIHEQTKELLGAVTSFTDITEIRSTQKALSESEEKWRSVLNNNKSGIFLIDKEYKIQVVNDDAKRRQSQMPNTHEIKEGMYFLDILPEARKGPVKAALDRVLKGEEVEYEVMYTKSNNEDLWLLASYAPVKNNDGQVTSICFTLNDVTSIKKNEEALSRSEQRWKFALDGAGDGVWEYNFQTRESYYSPLYKNMLGFNEDEFKNEAIEWHSRIHPDDVEKVSSIDSKYESGEIENHSIEYRLQNKSGEYIWVLDRGMLLERSVDGKPLILIGTHKDITEQKKREESLIQSRKLFSSFMANTPTMAWIIDENNIFRYLNTPYMKAFNLNESHVGCSIYDIFPKDICDQFVENNWRAWHSGKALETVEQGIGPDGQPQLYQIFKFPLETENGVRLLGGVALDITQKAMLEKKLSEEKEKKKREIIQAIIDAQENERKELAYELHDNVNQILTSSRLMLEVAAEKPGQSHVFVNRSLSYLQDAIIELRKISHNLIPGTLRDISLDAAIEEVVQNINSTGKIRIIFNKNVDDYSSLILPEIQLSLLRITQEQFNNILKHAAASEARLFLYISNEKISLTIQDNGVGFDTSVTKRGLGLNNIFNRVEYYHGIASLTSSPAEGCTLHIEFPSSALQANPEENN